MLDPFDAPEKNLDERAEGVAQIRDQARPEEDHHCVDREKRQPIEAARSDDEGSYRPGAVNETETKDNEKTVALHKPSHLPDVCPP